MSNSRRARRTLEAATRGGVILGRPTSHVRRVRNIEGKPLPCCYGGTAQTGPCDNDGDTRFRIEAPHEDPTRTGKLIYIFCSDSHKIAFAAGTRYEQYIH